MKKLLLILLIAIGNKIAAQNTDYLITAKGIGSLKIGMKKAEVEKVTGKKITLKNLLDKDGYSDTIKTKYKNIDVLLYLERQYLEEEKYDIVLSGIKTTSPLCKTSTGIGIGDDKIKIINAYENSSIYIWPEFEDDTYTKRSKTKVVISVYNDEDGNTINFSLLNKKVISIEITYAMEGD